MFRKFLPKTTCFFDFFEQHSAILIKACTLFRDLTLEGADIPALVARIKETEHEADDVTHNCIESLHKTFITPIDRYDIHRLIKRMDDIVDSVDAAAARVIMYEVTKMRPEAPRLASVLLDASNAVHGAILGLRNLKNAPVIMKQCIRIHEQESAGDAILRSALVRLFKEERDTVLVIKWKEIFERLERATDRCDDVANIIEGVVIETT